MRADAAPSPVFVIRGAKGDFMIKMLAATAAAALLATGAHAGTLTFDFGFTSQAGSPFEVAAGTFTTTDTLNADGAYDILAVNGTVSEPGTGGLPIFASITGLSDYFLADNELYPADPRVDFNGVGFTSSDGGFFNLFTNFDGTTQVVYSPTGSTDEFQRSYVTLAVTQVTTAAPEPGTWALMFAGVAMVGGVMRARVRAERRHAELLAAI